MNDLEQDQISLLRQGNETAFRKLVDDFQVKVYNTALGFVKNQADADDVTQEVFIEVFRSLSRFRGESRLSTWIYRIAVNKSLEHLRRKKQKKWFGLWNKPDEGNAIERNLPDFEHPGVLAENRERAKILAWALDKLPENQKVAYTLHKVEGLGYQEIAEVIQVSLSAVESLMHRARQNLQKHLKSYYES